MEGAATAPPPINRSSDEFSVLVLASDLGVDEVPSPAVRFGRAGGSVARPSHLHEHDDFSDLDALQAFRLEGSEKSGKRIFCIVGKFFTAPIISGERLKKYIFHKFSTELSEGPFCLFTFTAQLKGAKNEELFVASHKSVHIVYTVLGDVCIYVVGKDEYGELAWAEVIFVITSCVKDVCGKPPTERLLLVKYGSLCLDEIVWTGMLENTDKDRIKRLIRLRPPTDT